MTEDDLAEEFKNFEEKSKDEKIEMLQRLNEKLVEDGSNGFLQEIGVEGEMTIKVFDDEGNEKQTVKEDIQMR